MGFCHTTSVDSQRGSAIIFAIGMSLLVSALSVALLLWLMLDIRRVEQLVAGSERLAHLEIAEAMAAGKIKMLDDNWQDPWETIQGDIKIQAQLKDLSGRLNINTVFKRDLGQNPNPSFIPAAVMQRLLESMGVQEAQAVIEKLVSSNVDVFGVSNNPDFQPVSPYIYSTEDEIQQVNMNTTTPEVLAAILDIPEKMAFMILREKPFESSKDIIDILAKYELKYDPITPIEAWLGVESHYFVLETMISEKRPTRVYSVFHKDEDNITLLWRSWGSLP